MLDAGCRIPLPPGSQLVIVILIVISIGFTAPPSRGNHKATKTRWVFLTLSFVPRPFTKIKGVR
jgi:hypothetical protein